MKVLIVDDEKKARDTISRIIQMFFGEEINIEESSGVADAIDKIKSGTHDLLLLDINLKDGSGFDLLKNVSNDDLNIIFITAHEEYAIKACKVSALDYILKPVDSDELKLAIQKAQKRIKKGNMIKRLDAFMQNMSGNIQQLKKITLKTADNIFIINISDIIYCEADGNYTTFNLIDGRKIMVSKLLGEYEDMIGSERFIRTHQSYLVNTDRIIRYEKGDGGRLITQNEHSIPVSTRKKEIVMNFLNHS